MKDLSKGLKSVSVSDILITNFEIIQRWQPAYLETSRTYTMKFSCGNS